MQRFGVFGWMMVALMVTACGGSGPRIVDIGGECVELADCVTGAVCANDGTCQAEGFPGTLAQGAICVASSQCRLGLACSAGGTCETEGSPGTAAFDATCASPTDCRAGLSCTDAGVCKGMELPLWFGTTCAEEEEGPFRVHFEVPGDEPLADFYRLPFPNDARVGTDGRINMAGHPSPGALIPLVGDAVGNLIRVVEEDLDGKFGPNQAVFFRFSDYPATSKLLFGIPGKGTIALVDLTPDAPDDGSLPFRYEARSRATPYICDNWLALSTIDGRPLEPGRTYAAMVASAVENDAGDALVQDPDFTAMLAATAPSDGRLQNAWAAYKPLRDWLVAKSIDPAKLGGATVFTMQDPSQRARLVRQAVDAQDAPTLEGAVLCDGSSDPFAVAGDSSRGCTEGSEAWDEVQGTLLMPQFQTGTPPFKDFADGGAIPSTGVPPVARSQAVHVALSIPAGVEMPVAGWPVIVYGHGTGGSYTSFLREGLAELLAAASSNGSAVPFVVVGFDAPFHGPRNHPENHKAEWLDVDPSAYDPDVLFFNPLNVRAARDNGLQQAADTWSLVQWIKAADFVAETSPTGEALRFDLDKIFYLGHSQGGVVGAVAVAWEPAFRGAVFSGAGGLLIQSLLGKTSPNDIPSAVRVGLADPDVTRVHPVLNLAQQLAESGDGVNHARYVIRLPQENAEPRHVFQVFGVGDTYSPDATQYALARQLGLQQVPNGQTPLATINETNLPATGNAAFGTTGVVQLYAPASGSDAHFVLFERTDAPLQVAGFFASAVLNGTPTVQAP